MDGLQGHEGRAIQDGSSADNAGSQRPFRGTPEREAVVGKAIVRFEIGRGHPAQPVFFQRLLRRPRVPAPEFSPEAPRPYVLFYVEVDNLEEALARVEPLGSRTRVGPVTLPAGKFAWLSDAAGHTIGLWETPAAQIL